jgi:hypothetical protein
VRARLVCATNSSHDRPAAESGRDAGPGASAPLPLLPPLPSSSPMPPPSPPWNEGAALGANTGVTLHTIDSPPGGSGYHASRPSLRLGAS